MHQDSPAHASALSAASIRRFRLFVDMMPHLAWTATADGSIDFCNQPWCQYTGLTLEQTLHPAPASVVHPDDLAQCVERWKAALEYGTAYEAECRLRRKIDGCYRWHFCQVSPMWENDALIGWCGTFTDIDDRKRAVEEARKLERFFESIVENIPAMIFVKDAAELRFVRVNRAELEMIGVSAKDLIGRNDYDLFPREEADFFTANDRTVLENGELLDIPEEPLLSQKGPLILHTKKIPLRDENGRAQYLLGISEDITERKRAEEQLREKNRLLQEAARSEHEALQALKTAQSRLVQSEKLASLGQLVAGVAHEINNPLAFVANNHAVLERDIAMVQELLLMYQSADSVLAAADPAQAARIAETSERIDVQYTLGNLKELLTRSRDGLKRIQQIVLDLREFSRHDSASDKPEEADLNAGLQSTANIVHGRAASRNVELKLELLTGLPRVTCFAAKVNQVILNLLANAVDACPGGGKVTLRSRLANGGVELQVIDDGCGIDPEHLSKIFDPFFTTKPQGQGTGMGLSISYGIIAEHGGKISVESTPGKGTCFTVFLPISQISAA